MDGPGFPPEPDLLPVLLLWAVPVAVLVVSTTVAVVAGRRRRLRWWHGALAFLGVVAFGAPAVALGVPAQPWLGRGADAGVLECPLSGAAGSVTPGAHDGETSRAWGRCVVASRAQVGVTVGAYALLAGSVGVAVLRLRAATPSRWRTRVPRSEIWI